MGRSRRGRAIVIGGKRYRWFVTDPEGWIENARASWSDVLEARRLTLVVRSELGRGQKLLAWLPVYRAPIQPAEVVTPRGDGASMLRTPPQDTVVSPALVRRMIAYGLNHGWRPTELSRDFVVPEDVLQRLMIEAKQAPSKRV